MDREDRASVQNVFPCPNLESRSRYDWVERLNMAWEGPVGWGLVGMVLVKT